jgi:hypothetical protein
MDTFDFATRLLDAGHLDHVDYRSVPGSVWVAQFGGDATELVYNLDDWKLVDEGTAQAVMFLHDHAFSACARYPEHVFTVLRDGEVLQLSKADGIARLGERLHSGMSAEAYAQALARTQSPGGGQDFGARVLRDADDAGEEFAGRPLPALRPPQASRTDEAIQLTFCTRRRWLSGDRGFPRIRIDQWQVTAPAEGPATWVAATIYETAQKRRW